MEITILSITSRILSCPAAYIPRGVVHQAHTSAEDLAPEAQGEQEQENNAYQGPSMHLTFGLELAKEASVEMLLHHFLAKLPPTAFTALAEALDTSNTSSPESFRFESDNGRVSFECRSSVGFGSEGGAAPPRCTERDVLHLLLAAMAGHISEDEDAFMTDSAHLINPAEAFSTASLRKAVGLTARTTQLAGLNPRLLLPRGVEVFAQAVRRLGVQRLIRFLIEKKMLEVTSVPLPLSGVCEGDRGSGSVKTCASGADVGAEAVAETLHPGSGSAQKFTTLGSDFSCDYIDNFLRCVCVHCFE
jgi:hypothetical protein